MKAILLTSLLLIGLRWASSESSRESCDSKIYCQGPVLDHIQRARLFVDSKTFVDMKLVLSPETTLRDFNKLLKMTSGNPSKTQLASFVDTHFAPGNEFEDWTPADFKPDPKFLEKLDDLKMRNFAKEIVSIWPQLSRRIKSDVSENPDRYSLLPLPNGFIIPGGRFKETYYWDSYWILKGLLISEMTETVKNMLDNFLHLIDKYGFIPNGSRVYYLNRSQPPLFIPMVADYINKTDDIAWLKANMHLIEKEVLFWLENKTINVTKDGVTYTLAHYNSNSPTPRPESYIEDILTAEYFNNIEDQEECYRQLKSGAETGWDFSSRWFFDKEGGNKANLSHIQTSRVAPVDLNAYLCGNFKTLQGFYDKLGVSENAKYWQQKHEDWKNAIENVLYSEEDGIWFDYDTVLGKARKEFYPSNLAPLWAGAVDPAKASILGDKAVDYLLANKINEYSGGVPTSLELTGEQWDMPNAWPPLQSIAVFALENSGSTRAKSLARLFAKNFVSAVYTGHRDTDAVFEKYDATVPGNFGGGGEYMVQTGFGWTNGVVLEFLDYFNNDLVNSNI